MHIAIISSLANYSRLLLYCRAHQNAIISPVFHCEAEHMSNAKPPISRVDEWFDKWHLPDVKKLTAEEAKRALEELEKLVEQYESW
jgi:hypothetical protein